MLWALFIFALCAMPGRQVPQIWWLELVRFDKLVHAGIFFVLAVLIFLGLKNPKNTLTIITWSAACVVYGVLLEVMQFAWFTDRAYDVADAVANTAGVLLALVIFRKRFSNT